MRLYNIETGGDFDVEPCSDVSMTTPAPSPPTSAADAEGRTLRVHDAEMARTLLSLDRDITLALFMTGEFTLTQAAEALEVGLSTLHYRVQRLLDQGLVEVVREEARRGRPQKVYRAVAERFLVAFELSDHESLEALLLRLAETPHKMIFTSTMRVLTEHSLDWDVVVRVAEQIDTVEISLLPRGDDRPLDEMLLRSDMPAVGLAWTGLSLAFHDAKELQREMYELLERYKARSVAGEQQYMVQLSLSPLQMS
jgi:predicted transcriptional regulator